MMRGVLKSEEKQWIFKADLKEEESCLSVETRGYCTLYLTVDTGAGGCSFQSCETGPVWTCPCAAPQNQI